MSVGKRVAIVGWAQSPLVERNEKIHKGELLSTTVREALAGSVLNIEDIDMVIDVSCDTMDGTSISNVFVIEHMGAFLKEESKIEEDGAYGVLYAYLRLLAGAHTTAMIVAHGRTDTTPQFYSWMTTDPFLLRPLGVEMVSAYALQARRYLAKYHLDDRPAAKVVVKNRNNGARNPYTQVRSPIAEEEVLASPVVASPIKLADASPKSEGAAVIILATEERAREISSRPVWIEGVGYNHDLYYPGHRELARPESLLRAARMAYDQAGIRDPRQETDFAEVYEPFSFTELMLYEGLGLTGEGKGRELIESGVALPGGSYPVNPSGGALCANPIMVTGMIRMIEASRQLTGIAGDLQVKRNTGRALVHSTSGMCLQSNIVYVIGSSGPAPAKKPRPVKKQTAKPEKKKTVREKSAKPRKKAAKKASGKKPAKRRAGKAVKKAAGRKSARKKSTKKIAGKKTTRRKPAKKKAVKKKVAKRKTVKKKTARKKVAKRSAGNRMKKNPLRKKKRASKK